MENLIKLAKIIPLFVLFLVFVWWTLQPNTAGRKWVDRWVALNLKWLQSGHGAGYVLVRIMLTVSRGNLFLLYWISKALTIALNKIIVALIGLAGFFDAFSFSANMNLVLTAPDYVELTAEEKQILLKLQAQRNDFLRERREAAAAYDATAAEIDFYLLSKRRN